MQTTKRRGRKSAVDYEELPNSAARIRSERDRTLADVAREIQTGQSALHQFERTGRGIGRETQWRLAFALNVPIEKLLKPGKNFAAKIRGTLDYSPVSTV